MTLLVPLLEVLITSVVLLLCCYSLCRRKDKRYPPGPPGLPLIGNFHQIGKRPHLTFMKWKKDYGNIFSVRLGIDNAIVVSDPKMIKELLSDISTSGRVQNPVLLAVSDGNHGIINTEGGHWEAQRRFVLRTLRDFGFSKSSMEGMILEEVNSVLEWFRERQGSPVACNRVFNGAVVNSLWHIVSGRRTVWGKCNNNDNSEILSKSDNFLRALEETAKTGLLYAPFLRFIAPDLSGWTKLIKSTNELNQLSERTIKEHRTNFDNTCPQDLIDHYLLEMERTKEPRSSFFQEKGENNLKAIIIDLFEAGNETTSATLLWAFLYLSSHPKTQQKLIDELHSVIGTSRQPSLSDKSSLPYTEAVIMEVLRISSLTPLGVLHRMLADKMFYGYIFPKNTIIIPNIYASLNDPEIWGDPENFRPERFLSADEKSVIRHQALIPFSTGKRVCLGEALARDTLFLFTAGIFQKFRVYPDPDNPEPDLEPMFGLLSAPKPFAVIVQENM